MLADLFVLQQVHVIEYSGHAFILTNMDTVFMFIHSDIMPDTVFLVKNSIAFQTS